MTIQEFATLSQMTVEDASLLFGFAGIVCGSIVSYFMIWSVQ